MRLSYGELRRPGLEHHRVARPRRGHGRLGSDEDVHLAVGTELELVDVGLGLRAGAPADGALAERGAERHAEVGALAPLANQAVRPAVVEHAEEVVHVGIVDEQLAVLVLQGEQLRVNGVGLLHEPLQREARQPGHPSVALSQVDGRLGDPGRLVHDVERRLLGGHPGVEGLVETGVLHRR